MIMEETRITYVGYIDFEMTLDDAKKCYHQGKCDADVDIVMKKQYIKEQLSEFNNEQIKNSLLECGCEFDENDRNDMESLIVWMAAGNIVEDYLEESRFIGHK